MSAADRRTYARRWKQNQRDRALEAAQLQAKYCPRRQGTGTCAGLLETYIEAGTGRTRVRCPLCDRRRRGICRDCNAPVYGALNKAIRCEVHAAAAKLLQQRASEEKHRDVRLEKSRAYYQNSDEVRRRRNEYKRAWRKANPEKVRAQKQRYVGKHKTNPRSAYSRYHARYRKKFQEHRREIVRDRLVTGVRKTSPKCTRCGKSTRWRPLHKGHAGRPWTVCTKCLFPCERKARLASRRRALQRSKAWLESIPKPARIKRPPQSPEYGPAKERLCLGGCGRVLTHRKKKCTRCKEADAQRANEQLAAVRGRGRRTDLARVA